MAITSSRRAEYVIPCNTVAQEPIEVLVVVAEALRELHSASPEHLYARVAEVMTLPQYQACIRILKRGGLVTEENRMLTWLG